MPTALGYGSKSYVITTRTRTCVATTIASGVRCPDAWQSTLPNSPTDEDLDAAASALIKRLATVLYIEEMQDIKQVRIARSRTQMRLACRATYKRWIDTDRVDRLMEW